MSNSKRIPQLEGLRALMMLIILLSHFEFFEQTLIADFYKTYLHNPTMGVDYFFMLSGFGLYLSIIGKREDVKAPFIDVRGGTGELKKYTLCTSLQ